MRLLIVGKQSSELSRAAQISMTHGAKVTMTESIEMALASIRKGQGVDLVMMDVEFDIAGFIRALSAERIAMPVVACGIAADSESAVASIKAGAREFVPLPPDAELIAAILDAVVEENSDMLAADPAMKKIITLADQIAPSEASVLITGESGVGKEVVAKYIHSKSRRAEKPFISINCAAIPENLLESELFGHEKGAFTGAVARRIGKFEEANTGTLLLDEISEMDVRLQAKLLRVLQSALLTASAVNRQFRLIFACLQHQTETYSKPYKKEAFAKICCFVLMSSIWQCPLCVSDHWISYTSRPISLRNMQPSTGLAYGPCPKGQNAKL